MYLILKGTGVPSLFHVKLERGGTQTYMIDPSKDQNSLAKEVVCRKPMYGASALLGSAGLTRLRLP
jgi:hypothetical protein